MFTVGGTDVNIHKYLGPKNPTEEDATADIPHYDAITETNIQDLLFLENRDRKYDPDVYTIRGIYSVQDIDFNLSQFGLFLNNDTLFMTIHINSSVKTIGRKIMSGDVIELPHMKDEYAANDFHVALKSYYVVEEVSRAAEGYSPTWYPHLYRLKCKQIVDSQEFKEILDLPMDEEVPAAGSLRDLLSTYEKDMQVNNAVIAQAEADAKKSGYETGHYFTLQTNDEGRVELVTADLTELDASVANELADRVMQTPERTGYTGYLLGDGIAPNGEIFGHGTLFPEGSVTGDYFLRTDMVPNRLFRYDGRRWIKMEDNVRMTMTQTNDRSTQKGTFINNTNVTTVAGESVPERQSVSKALKAKTDNV
jgi:D-ribose pyranose/furanose isomerase RbsD